MRGVGWSVMGVWCGSLLAGEEQQQQEEEEEEQEEDRGDDERPPVGRVAFCLSGGSALVHLIRC